MEKVFVSYEIALELKELGFKEQCFSFYDIEKKLYASEGYYKIGYNVLNEEVIAPLYQQVFRWFREKYQLPSWIYTSDNIKFYYSILKNKRYMVSDYYVVTKTKAPAKPYETYEEAQLACLLKLIEILKNKQNDKQT